MEIITLREILEKSQKESWTLSNFINYMFKINKIDLTNDEEHKIQRKDFESFLKSIKS